MRHARWIAAALIPFLIGSCIYLGSCVYALKTLGDSARSGDGQAVLARTDLLRLRRSLAIQLLAAYDRRQGTGKPPNALQQLLKSAAPNIADQIVAQILTPERLSQLLGIGRLQISNKSPPVEMPAIADIKGFVALSQIRVVNPVTVSFRTKQSAEGYVVIMHFENFAWKLAGLELPESVFANIVAAIR